MAWFVKTETFTAVAAVLSVEQRRSFIRAHRQWLQREKAKGRLIQSGFLVDEKRNPGGGSLLVFAANNFQEALKWIQNDPMIMQDLVVCRLANGSLITMSILSGRAMAANRSKH